MAINSGTPQGTLDRLRGSITVTDNSDLNVTSDYLGVGGITVAPSGNVTDFINTMTGRVTSPVPYIPVEVTINMLRTQTLAAAWYDQALSNSLLGAVTITPDVTTFPNITLRNCGITSLPSQSYAGTDPSFDIVISGYMIVNAQLWAAA